MDAKEQALGDTPSMMMSPISAVVAFAVARGVAIERICEVTGQTLAELLAPRERAPEQMMSVLLELLQRSMPGQAVAVELAEAAPDEMFGPLTEAVRLAKDVRGALALLVQYRGMISTNLQLELITSEPAGALLTIAHPRNDAREGGYGTEVGMAWMTRALRRLVGARDVLERVDFAHEPFGPRAAFEAFFSAPLRLGASSCGLLVRRALLTRPLAGHDPARFSALRAHLDLVLERLPQRGVPEEVRRAREAVVHNAARGEYGVDPLARRLGLSVRTLQRRLAEHGTSTRALIDEVREANARQLLTDASMSLGEVAFLLGYSTESAFRRAFRRWTEQTPGQYRRALR